MKTQIRTCVVCSKMLPNLNLEHRVSSHFQTIADDHIPFKEKGIPAIDLIDFHNLQHWHKPSDKLSAISLNSIEEASKLAMHIFT